LIARRRPNRQLMSRPAPHLCSCRDVQEHGQPDLGDVPYKHGPASRPDFRAGGLLVRTRLPASLAQVQRKLKGRSPVTSRARTSALLDIPTSAESAFRIRSDIVVPSSHAPKTPPEIVENLKNRHPSGARGSQLWRHSRAWDRNLAKHAGRMVSRLLGRQQ